MLFRSEQQRKTLGVPSEGFSIPNFGVDFLHIKAYEQNKRTTKGNDNENTYD